MKLGLTDDEVMECAQELQLAPPAPEQQMESPKPADKTAPRNKHQNSSPEDWTDERNDRFRLAWTSNEKVKHIAKRFGVSKSCVSKHAQRLGLAKRERGRKANQAMIGGTQRRFKGVSPGERTKAAVRLHPWHPANRHGATIYGKTVTPASQMNRLLKSGQHNRKIGRVCTKGRWKGMEIYTLTLEERATCPRTCEVWAECYGNNMGQTQRIIDDGTLTERLKEEMLGLAKKHPKGFIVRLHVLGDFYSEEYVKFWDDALYLISELHIFGFTARLPTTPIGQALVHLMNDHLDQVAMRWSGLKQELHGSEVIKREEDAIGVVCPAQKDPDRCCATCALCWNSELTISFLEH